METQSQKFRIILVDFGIKLAIKRLYFMVLVNLAKIKRVIKMQKILSLILCINLLNASEPLLIKADSPNYIHALAYATKDNFMGLDIYSNFNLKECYVHKDLKANLEKLAQILQERNLKIVFYDCFRPNEAQKIAWEKFSDENFVANPYKNGSNHSRGIALDVGLADENGEILPMPSEFDSFTPNAYSNFVCKDTQKHKCQNRELLKSIMQEAGFKSIKTEWWHFEADFKTLSKKELRQKYPLLERLK